jgi:ATP-dependent RNA helicase MSS116
LLVLFPFEAQFLSELRGIDISHDSVMTDILQQASQLELPKWMAQNLLRIQNGGTKLSVGAQLAYLSFLGYYLGQAKRIHCNKSDVVTLSNEFSKAIRLAYVPALSPKLISKMELVGVAGVIRDDVNLSL